MHSANVLKTWAHGLQTQPRRNTNHTLHLLLTMGTMGLWLPVWLGVCLFLEGWKSGHNWTLAGKTAVGMKRIEDLRVSPEMRRALCKK